jgi:hypothetical protein
MRNSFHNKYANKYLHGLLSQVPVIHIWTCVFEHRRVCGESVQLPCLLRLRYYLLMRNKIINII